MMDTPKRTTKAKTVNGQRVTPVSNLPASQRVNAPRCASCHSDSTFIYATRSPKHYFKCRRCGYTDYFESRDIAGVVDDIQTR
jgi:hypothetical protein